MRFRIRRITLWLLITASLLFCASCEEFNPLTASGSGNCKMYWVSNIVVNTSVQRADLDASNMEDLASGAAFTSIAIEKKSGKLYLAGGSCNGVYWANLDGSGYERIISEAGGTYDIDIDPIAEKIYYIRASGSLYIYRAELDGSNVQDVTPSGYGAVTAGSEKIALDPFAGKIYYVDSATSILLKRANLDGTSVETLKTNSQPIYEIALDLENEKMYWSDGNSMTYVSDLDGNGQTTVLTGSAPFYMAIDPFEEKLYWTYEFGAQDQIIRADLDGSNQETLMQGTPYLNDPRGIILDLWP